MNFFFSYFLSKTRTSKVFFFFFKAEVGIRAATVTGVQTCALPISLSPCTTLNTPSGRPASAYRRATRLDADGSRSLGLRMKVLPQAIAIGCIHIGTIAGKLNGVMPAQTPSGWRKEYASTPLETWSE